MAQKPATTPIPVQLSTTEFTAFILPHLSMPCGQNIQTWLSPRNSTHLSFPPTGARNRLFLWALRGPPALRNAGVAWALAGIPETGSAENPHAGQRPVTDDPGRQKAGHSADPGPTRGPRPIGGHPLPARDAVGGYAPCGPGRPGSGAPPSRPSRGVPIWHVPALRRVCRRGLPVEAVRRRTSLPPRCPTTRSSGYPPPGSG